MVDELWRHCNGAQGRISKMTMSAMGLRWRIEMSAQRRRALAGFASRSFLDERGDEKMKRGIGAKKAPGFPGADCIISMQEARLRSPCRPCRRPEA